MTCKEPPHNQLFPTFIFIIIIIIIIINKPELNWIELLFTAIGFSPGGSSPYTSTHNTNVFTRWQ
jgi:hypothetical protein